MARICVTGIYTVTMSGQLAEYAYGKIKIRVMKVNRERLGLRGGRVCSLHVTRCRACLRGIGALSWKAARAPMACFAADCNGAARALPFLCFPSFLSKSEEPHSLPCLSRIDILHEQVGEARRPRIDCKGMSSRSFLRRV